jgi:hypothetical protein
MSRQTQAFRRIGRQLAATAVAAVSGEFATLIAIYGPALMAACLRKPTDWVTRAIRAERLVEIDDEIDQLKREREKLAQ